ncbi:hypothetical protein HPB50_014468 [Hyalomma asiaticum]|uniref:Uncharacterized protein n=1 Tax=Hyalomma asiaticum TaxID=266040 RepID=A0ACB7T8G4_HYAAI|nr:hypothetical protein HPB50_014468 [Hyalomma asiaticum]
MSSYELPANADEHVLRRKIEEAQGNLLSLDISNCIVAHPSALLSLLSTLTNLRCLSCIACPLKPSLLLKRLLLSLQNLSRLEFSLVQAVHDAVKNRVEIEHFHEELIGKHSSISEIYVEVANEANMRLLLSFLRYCPLVTDIHIYAANCIPSDHVTPWCFAIMQSLGQLVMFTLNGEAQFTMQSELAQPLDLRSCMDTLGTVVFNKSAKALSYAALRDLATSPRPVHPVEPVVLVAVQSSGLHKELLDASSRYHWRWLQSLCFVLVHSGHHETAYPVVSARYRTILQDFFSRLTDIVELNLSCFHFGDGIDITELIPAAVLQRLRALSLPPCALPPPGAVLQLVMDLSHMEDLDIRLHMDGRHRSCLFCDEALTIPPEAASAFRLSSGRFTLSNVPQLTSFNFLGCIRVSHVRFIGDHGFRDPNKAYNAFCKAICSNDNIRSIVIKLPYICFRARSFETSLCPANALERLCILTTNCSPQGIGSGGDSRTTGQQSSICILRAHSLCGL